MPLHVHSSTSKVMFNSDIVVGNIVVLASERRGHHYDSAMQSHLTLEGKGESSPVIAATSLADDANFTEPSCPESISPPRASRILLSVAIAGEAGARSDCKGDQRHRHILILMRKVRSQTPTLEPSEFFQPDRCSESYCRRPGSGFIYMYSMYS